MGKFHLTIIVALSGLLAVSAIQAEASQTDAKPVADKTADEKDSSCILPEDVRKYVVERYFKDSTPEDEVINKAVEILTTPESIIKHVEQVEWESGQLDRFAVNKLSFILKTPAGEDRSLVFRDGKKRKDALLTPARTRILTRMYNDTAFSASEHTELSEAKKLKELNPVATLETAIKAASAEYEFDDETLKRARENLSSAKDAGSEFAIGLAALANVEHAVHNQWAAIWLISRMDKMSFRREGGEGSIPDLQAMDAQTFFENVYYATKARKNFPWGKLCNDSDFLEYVLSPRGSGEPIQRWRRHFFKALEPELKGKSEADAKDVVKLVIAATYDFYQYEGDTTWEDFGMLTALAVHEGRCEDCSNVENCMLRSVGFPAAQAFTPWWGHSNGNHAWTVVPSLDKGKNNNGKRAAKVYLKTWDKYVDVTAINTKVTEVTVEFDEGVTAERASLSVWNHEEWRSIARTDIDKCKAVFNDVGCKLNFVLLFRAEGSSDKLVKIVDGKVMHILNHESTAPSEKAFELEFDKSCKLGEFDPSEEYSVEIHTSKGWLKIDSTRAQTGSVSFKCDPERLYRLVGKGMRDRPFVAEFDDEEDEFQVTRF